MKGLLVYLPPTLGDPGEHLPSVGLGFRIWDPGTSKAPSRAGGVRLPLAGSGWCRARQHIQGCGPAAALPLAYFARLRGCFSSFPGTLSALKILAPRWDLVWVQ